LCSAGNAVWLNNLFLAGRIEALLAQWERKEKSRRLEKPTIVEKPVVLEKSLPQPRSFVVEKAGFHEAPSSGVKTLGLDINSFVPVCFLEPFVLYLCHHLFTFACLIDFYHE
jgi:hypothetical protein